MERPLWRGREMKHFDFGTFLVKWDLLRYRRLSSFKCTQHWSVLLYFCLIYFSWFVSPLRNPSQCWTSSPGSGSLGFCGDNEGKGICLCMRRVVNEPPSEASVTDLSLSSQCIADVGRSRRVAQVDFGGLRKPLGTQESTWLMEPLPLQPDPWWSGAFSGLFVWLFCLQNWLCAYLPNILCLFYLIVYLFLFSFIPASLPV